MNLNEQITEIVRWGLPLDEIKQLDRRLQCFYARFRAHIRPKTQDSSEYGLRYVSGLLRMETKRNMANIGRKTDVSIQNMHLSWPNNTSVPQVAVIAAHSFRIDEVFTPYGLRLKYAMIVPEKANEIELRGALFRAGFL